MRTTIVTSLVSLFVASTAFGAPEDHPAELLLLMRLIDQVPTRAQMDAAGAGRSGKALVAIARDRDLPRYPRIRAAGSLALFDTPASRQALAALLDDEAIEDPEVKIQALAALVHLEGTRTLPRLDDLLDHVHPELRAAAVRNLGRLDHPAARTALRARAEANVEPVPWIERLLTRELGRLERDAAN